MLAVVSNSVPEDKCKCQSSYNLRKCHVFVMRAVTLISCPSATAWFRAAEQVSEWPNSSADSGHLLTNARASQPMIPTIMLCVFSQFMQVEFHLNSEEEVSHLFVSLR